MEIKEIVEKYDLKLAERNGVKGFTCNPKFMNLKDLFAEKKPEIMAYLENKEAEQKAQAKADEQQAIADIKADKYPIEFYKGGYETFVKTDYAYDLVKELGLAPSYKQGGAVEVPLALLGGNKIYYSKLKAYADKEKAKELAAKKAEKAKKEIEKDAKEAKAFAEAKKTGKKQILGLYNEPCNDNSIDCDLDNIITYAMPDGSTKTERVHTY